MIDMFKRVELYKALPLDTPFSVQVSPSNHCNFKCKYCLHALPENILAKKNFRREFMDFSLFKKLVDDIACFSRKIKALVLVGYGEPLLHKNIVDMVDYAKRRDIADRVEIVTNGAMLTKEMSDGLINAGLDSLKISIQGVDGDAYRATMGRKFDFDKFIAQLKYFFDHRRHTKINCKIIDVAFRTKDEESEFRRIFNPVCDETTIECETPIIREAENKSDFSTTRYGMTIKKVNICPPPILFNAYTC